MTHFRIALLLLLINTSANIVQAQKISYLSDAEGVSFAEAKRLKEAEKFTPSETNILNFAQNSKPLWVHISFDSLAAKHQYYVIYIENAHLDTLDFYHFTSNGEVYKQSMGDHFVFDARDYDYFYPNIMYKRPISECYLRARTEGALLLPIFMKPEKGFFEVIANANTFLFFFIGVLFITLLVNIFFFLRLKEPIHLYYAFFIVGVYLVVLTDKEIFFQYFWQETPMLNKYNAIFYSGVVLQVIFIGKFLDFKNDSKILYIIHLAIVASNLLTILLNIFVGYNFAIVAFTIINIVYMVYYFFASLYMFFRFKINDMSTLLLLLGISIFFVFGLIYSLSVIKVIPYLPFEKNFLEIGVLIEVLFGHLAVTEKLNQYKADKSLAQMQLINVMEENERAIIAQNMQLEEKVLQRTKELEEKNQEIQAINEELITHQEELTRNKEMLERQNKIIEGHNIYLDRRREKLEKRMEEHSEALKKTINELSVKYENLKAEYEALKAKST